MSGGITARAQPRDTLPLLHGCHPCQTVAAGTLASKRSRVIIVRVLLQPHDTHFAVLCDICAIYVFILLFQTFNCYIIDVSKMYNAAHASARRART